MAQRFTARVRRGFQWMLDTSLERETQIKMANAQRYKQITKSEVLDVEAALKWMKEQAHGQQMADVSGPEDPAAGA